MKEEFRHQNGVVSATVITRFSSLLRSSLRNASVGFITLPPFVVFILQLSLCSKPSSSSSSRCAFSSFDLNRGQKLRSRSENETLSHQGARWVRCPMSHDLYLWMLRSEITYLSPGVSYNDTFCPVTSGRLGPALLHELA
jgi:hypothetical protein